MHRLCVPLLSWPSSKIVLPSVRVVQCITPCRGIETQAASDSFQASQVSVSLLPETRRTSQPSFKDLVFGHSASEHMLEVYWSHKSGWSRPAICPVHNISLHPSAKVLHYAQELFEGMKAYRGVDGKIRLFRPELNMQRMRRSAQRLCLPDFNGDELLTLIKNLVRVDARWVPPMETSSTLYIRPTYMGIEPTLGVSPANEAMLFVLTGPVGPYFKTGGLTPVSLYARNEYARAWPGGAGEFKLGSNYAPTLAVQKEALKHGCQQVLWLYGQDHQLTEVGTMNIFVYVKTADGQRTELWTPPLSDGLILPGVTRQSLIELARSWNEFEVIERRIPMAEFEQLLEQKRVLEVFGAGTACVVCPVGKIDYEGRVLNIPEPKLAYRLHRQLLDIQHGVVKHPWAVSIDE